MKYNKLYKRTKKDLLKNIYQVLKSAVRLTPSHPSLLCAYV